MAALGRLYRAHVHNFKQYFMCYGQLEGSDMPECKSSHELKITYENNAGLQLVGKRK